MDMLLKTGRAFYGVCIAVIGLNQLVYADFRTVILPPWPSWRIEPGIAAYITGVLMIGVGLGMAFSKNGRELALAWGAVLAVILLCWHLPYLLFIQPNELRHLGIWAEASKTLAHCGGALVLAGTYQQQDRWGSTWLKPARLMQIGRIMFCITIIEFGIDHWVYAEMLGFPPWIPGDKIFWLKFTGTALIAAGVGIATKIWIRPAAFALSAIIFIWIFTLHIPLAVMNPHGNHGNEWASTADALGYSGVALMIACIYTRSSKRA